MHDMDQLDLFAALERGLRAEERRDRVREFYARKSAEAKAAKARNKRHAAAQRSVAKSRATLQRVSQQPDDDTPPW
jgi:predicted Holliday junction resolvase-like endonuclease